MQKALGSIRTRGSMLRALGSVPVDREALSASVYLPQKDLRSRRVRSMSLLLHQWRGVSPLSVCLTYGRSVVVALMPVSVRVLCPLSVCAGNVLSSSSSRQITVCLSACLSVCPLSVSFTRES